MDTPSEVEPGLDSGLREPIGGLSTSEPPLAPEHDVDAGAVQEALSEGDVDTALALVMDDRWAHAMLDDEDGSLRWIIECISPRADPCAAFTRRTEGSA